MKVHQMLLALALASTLGAHSALADQEGKAKGHAKAKAAKAAKDERNDQPMRFRDMDQNGDRVITRAEWRGNDQSFKEHDTNGDGVLSGNEVLASVERPVPDRSR